MVNSDNEDNAQERAGDLAAGNQAAPAAQVINEDDMERAMTNALNQQARHIHYKDYKTTDDFLAWLAGYRAKVQDAYNFGPNDKARIDAQIVKSISSRLEVGSALDAYNRLDPQDKTNYEALVQRLTEEFIDPHEKGRFNENIRYNIRKKGQALKDFMQAVKRDMNRYSDLPDEVYDRAGAASANPEKIRQGVRRFRAGIRTAKGKKCKELTRQLKYHMTHSKELTWENALLVASKWELACDNGESDSDDDDDDDDNDDDDGDDGDEAVAVEVKSKKGKKSKAKEKAKSSENTVLASLSDQVSENQMKIKKLETAQERTATTLTAVKD